MPFVTLPSGVEIFYETQGEGPPLLLVSGTGHDHTFWSAQLPLLSADYRCIVFDNRGVGRSTAPALGYSLADMADDAAGVLDAAGVERAHVMGFSMGGHISTELTLRHPGRVVSLGLHHTWARNCARLGSFQRARMRFAARGERGGARGMSLLAFTPTNTTRRTPRNGQKRQWLTEQSGVISVGRATARLPGGITLEALHQIKVPTSSPVRMRRLVDPHHAKDSTSASRVRKLISWSTDTGAHREPDAFARIS